MKKLIIITENQFHSVLENTKIKHLLHEWYENSVDIDNVNSIWVCKNIIEGDEDDPEDEDYIEYEIQYLDNEDNSLGYDTLEYDDIVDKFGENMAQYIDTECSKKLGKDVYFTDLQDTSVSNLNDVNEVNALAKKLWTNGEWYPGARGYLLTDGTVIHFGDNTDHVSISMIDGMTVGKFVSLGNIRIGKDSFQLEKEPTNEQYSVLRRLIASVDTCYVDITHYTNGTYADNICGNSYTFKSPQYVLGCIRRYFSEGIKL